jgi:hypothetical protein
MLRKCLQDEDIPYPHSVIDFYDGIKIIDIPESYTVYQPLTDSEGEPIIEQTGLDEDGNPIYEQPIGPVEIEVDVESVGEEASWYDVRNPMYFDLRIDEQLYSWKKREGALHIGLEDGYLGLVNYIPVKVNDTVKGNYKRIIKPKFTPLRLVNGMLTVNGAASPNMQFVNAITGDMTLLGDVRLERDDISKPPYFPPIGDVDDE